jgi:hypothetical protein
MSKASKKLKRQRRRQRRRDSLPRWTPFERTTLTDGPSDFGPHNKKDECVIYVNSRYLVRVHPTSESRPLIKLSIKHLDLSTRHDWRDFQRIKNELLGEEYEAVELYPAESRLVDMANQYHLWAYPKEGMSFSLGFYERRVSEWVHPQSRGSQRPWPKGEKPRDLLSGQEVLAWVVEANGDHDQSSSTGAEQEEKHQS